MSEETRRKTLANCKLSEFARQANAIRHYVSDYYKTLDLAAVKKAIVDNAESEEAKQSSGREYVSRILDKMLDENAESTVRLIGMLAFLSMNEAEQLAPGEAIDIVLECITSDRVTDFFISAANWAGINTGGISKTLISLKSMFSGNATSENQSSISTNSTSES